MAKSRARDLSKEAAWRRRLDRQAQSGQSIRSWCRRHGVKEAAFHWWRRELARRDLEAQAGSFVPVQVTDDLSHASNGQIEIELTEGRSIRVTGPVNRQALTDVLDVLERRPC